MVNVVLVTNCCHICADKEFFVCHKLKVVAVHLLDCLSEVNPPELIGLRQGSQTGHQTALDELVGFRPINQVNKQNIMAEI